MQLRYLRASVGRDRRREGADQLVAQLIKQTKQNPDRQVWQYTATITDQTLLEAFESQWLGRSRDSHLYKLSKRIEAGLQKVRDPMSTKLDETYQGDKLESISVIATRPASS